MSELFYGFLTLVSGMVAFDFSRGGFRDYMNQPFWKLGLRTITAFYMFFVSMYSGHVLFEFYLGVETPVKTIETKIVNIQSAEVDFDKFEISFPQVYKKVRSDIYHKIATEVDVVKISQFMKDRKTLVSAGAIVEEYNTGRSLMIP